MATSDIQQMVIDSANKYGIPVGIALAQANAESGLNTGAVSNKGAGGVMQLMPATAKELGVTNIFDPGQNIDAGFKYLKQLFNQFGDWALALAAYNAGPGTVAKYGGIPPYPETQNYVTKIMGNANATSTDVIASVNDTSNPESGSTDWASMLAIGLGIGVVLWKLRG